MFAINVIRYLIMIISKKIKQFFQNQDIALGFFVGTTLSGIINIILHIILHVVFK